MTSENLIRVQNLVVRRGNATVLNIQDLTIRQGRVLAFIGPNGAGKSTLLLTLAGLLRQTGGTIYFQDQPVNSVASLKFLRQNTSLVFQEPLLLNDTVYNNVALGLKFRKLKSSEILRSVSKTLNYFGISHLAKRSARTLSGGEAKRVSLARAFTIKPKLILLDEAFNSLDPPSRESIIEDLQNVLNETRITAVLALHDREETLRLAQDVAVMSKGRIAQYGKTTEIFNQPADVFVAGFVGTESILEGSVIACSEGFMTIAVCDKVIEANGDFPAGKKVYCCLRPESVTVMPCFSGITGGQNTFPAVVRKIVRQAYIYKLYLNCGFPLAAYITMPSFENMDICEGLAVTVSFKASAVHVLDKDGS